MKIKLSKKLLIQIAVIIGIVIIPLLYSYLYLGAFWDPYSRLETMPVAVVNNDKGAQINGVERNVGNEMCERLKEDASLKFIFTDEQDAEAGTKGNDYYAMLIIPENFSEDIASAGTTDKQTAKITFSANEKHNFLASQILSRAVLEIEESTRADINKEIVAELAQNINAVPNQMMELQSGLSDLKSGSEELKEGTATLAEGTKTFSDKLNEYKSGVSELKDGTATITTGAESLNTGLDELQAGADQLSVATENIGDISDGAKSLATGAKALDSGVATYTAGVDTLIASVNSTSEFLKNYVTNVNPAIMKDPTFAGFITQMSDPKNAKQLTSLKKAGTQLTEASSQLSEGATALSEGSKKLPQLKESLASLSGGLTQVRSGSKELADGAKALALGADKLDTATSQLSEGAGDIMDGATKVNEGMTKLDDGIQTAKSGVEDAVAKTNDQLDSLDGLADYAAAPVSIEQDNVTSVPNYGTAFAPYFLSLSLWVGGLIIFVGIYLDAEGKFKILSRDSEHKVARSFLYLLIGLVQALVLAEALRYGLGLKVANLPLYYAACGLVSVVFISIVQFLMVHLKDTGKFLSILFLILQLTSCGGTFPMETVPKFFNVLYPYMPMTYSVGLFKQAISGVDKNEALYNAGILCIFLVVFMALTLLLSGMKSNKTVKTKAQETARIY